jgi:hypothetical protein
MMLGPDYLKDYVFLEKLLKLERRGYSLVDFDISEYGNICAVLEKDGKFWITFADSAMGLAAITEDGAIRMTMGT